MELLCVFAVMSVACILSFLFGYRYAGAKIFSPHINEIVRFDGRRYWVCDRTEWWTDPLLPHDRAKETRRREPP